MPAKPAPNSTRRERMWLALAFVLVVLALVVAYLAARPLVGWIGEQLRSQDVDV